MTQSTAIQLGAMSCSGHAMMLANHFGMRGFSVYIMQTAILDQTAVVSQNAWSFYLYDGSDVILTGRGAPRPVDWTGLAGFQKTIHRAHLGFSIQHA